MTEIEQIQFNAFKTWYLKRKDKLKRFGWKYSGESYLHDDRTLIVVLLNDKNRHFLQVTTKGEIAFAPMRMTCF
jgi:predicted site-specific integrase-resolvase